MFRLTTCLFLCCFLTMSAHEAQAQAQRDPQATTLVSQSLQAADGTTVLTDVTLTGTATRTAGSDIESGTVTLRALGGLDGRMDLTLTNGPRSEVINQSHGTTGEWSGPDGAQHAMAQHNSFVPAAWFFPALALAQALNDPSIQLAYVGQEMKESVAVQHIRFWRMIPAGISSDGQIKLFEHLTSADVYLDAANSLPVALDFNLHPDGNELLDIPVKVRYSDYQKLNGILLPGRVQKFINNSLLLDLNITGAAVNTNLSPAEFGTN